MLVALLAHVGYFLLQPAQVMFFELFNSCNGFAYDRASNECLCIEPYYGSSCELNRCVHGEPEQTSLGARCICESGTLWTGDF